MKDRKDKPINTRVSSEVLEEAKSKGWTPQLLIDFALSTAIKNGVDMKECETCKGRHSSNQFNDETIFGERFALTFALGKTINWYRCNECGTSFVFARKTKPDDKEFNENKKCS